MNRDDIIRLARKAGLSNEIGAFGYPYLPELERFAALVAAAERDAAVKDAERYRWLKKENSRTFPSTASACVTFNIGHDWIVESDLDAAIDAARGEA